MSNLPLPENDLAALHPLPTVSNPQENRPEPIALIGMGCRFPGRADTPEAFWQLLRNGVDTVTDIPATRWNVAEHYDPERTVPGKMYVRAGAFLDEIDQFDPEFFRMTPREATHLDPQQRLLLEVSWEALEYAGLAPAQLAGSQTGVFVGSFWDDYAVDRLYRAPAQALNVLSTLSSFRSMVAGRIAHALDLHGPTLQIDTACSSSLLAVHLACQALRNRECNLALAGGVSLILSPELLIGVSQMNALSADGRCKTFAANADGFGRGEGCGMVVLKRLSDAQADGDTILALIRGSATNHDGRSLTLTTPDSSAQQAVVRQALANAHVEPHQVQYIEAHGTGTPLGDPIELSALGKVFGQNRQTPLIVGSVKTNIGHLDPAAGVSGLIKVVLSLTHSEIPPHLHFGLPNPLIPWHRLPMTVPTQLTPWQAQPKIAGISAFGMSGTNVHLIVEEAPRQATPLPTLTRPYHLLTLSARDEKALDDLVQRYSMYLATTKTPDLADICYTAAAGRSHFEQRLAIVAESTTQLQAQLALTLERQPTASLGASGSPPPLAFLFTGQGSQYVNMGRELYETQPTFRATLERCDAILRPLLDESILQVLYPDKATKRHGDTENGQSEFSPAPSLPGSLASTFYAQPALFALEYALATLWQSWDIQPDILLGHSIGELVAACVAGVFSLEDGLKLVAARGRLMSALPAAGAMVAVAAAEARVQQAIAPYPNEVSIAAVNGPANMVIAGQQARVHAIAEQLASEGIKTQPLTVSHAFHSPLMEPMLADFAQVAATITYHPPKLRLISNVTGQLAGAEITTPAYWVRHIRETVRFADGVTTLHAQGIGIFLEIGPKPTLLGMTEECLDRERGRQGEGENYSPCLPLSLSPCLFLPSLRAKQSDWQQMLTSLGKLYESGMNIDWLGFDRDYARHKVVLPTYPFQRQRYWLNAPNRQQPASTGLRPLIDRMTRLPLHQETLFETEFSVDALPFLADHRVYDRIVSPAACQLAMVLNAAALTFGQEQGLHLENVILPQALVIPEATARTVQTVLSPLTSAGDEPRQAFKLISFDPVNTADTLATHATGDVVAAVASPSEPVTLSALRQHCDHAVDIAAFYRAMTAAQLELGPTFRWIAEMRRGEAGSTAEGLAQLVVPTAVHDATAHLLHPGLLDACFQVAGMLSQPEAQQTTLLPFAVGALHCYQPAKGKRWWCHASQTDKHQWDIRLLDEQGITLVSMEAFEMRAAAPAAVRSKEVWRDWLYQVKWQPSPAFGHLPMVVRNEPPVSAAWLIFADRQGVGEALATYLRQRGHTPILVYANACYQPFDGQTSHIRPDCAEDYQHLLSALPAVQGIVHLWSLDMPTLQATTDLVDVVQPSYGSVLHLVQTLLQQQIEPTALWLVTRDAQAITPTDAVTGVAQAGVWGMGKVIALEHPELNCVCLDLGASATPESQAADLGTEITAGVRPKEREAQIALRRDSRYVARLTRHQAEQGLPMPDGACRLEITERGTLDNLQLRPMTRRTPGLGEVEIQVQAGGLNFRDVLSALGLYPGEPGSLGLECAGIVVAVGPDVTKFAIGNAVLALASGSFGHYVTVHTTAVIQKPTTLSPVEAATIPGVFLTAYYGLHQLAQIKAGDRVLIHAAAGGVGLAAVQLAQQVGAEVFGTASPGKWDTLRQWGVTHLYNSRTLAFAEQIMADTQGAGVDIVLNSLTGPGFIEATLATLAPNGKLVEMSKRDVWSAEQVATVRPDVDYTRFDLNEVSQQQPALLATMFKAIAELLTTNRLRPLPATVFSIREAVAAFAYMQQAKHIGKIVLTIPSVDAHTVQAEATYLITGGLGGLGLAMAQWLVAQGARQLLLVGRSQPRPAVQSQLDALAAAGVTVTVAQTDVTSHDAMRNLVEQIDPRYPLRGVIHSVGVLDDGALLQQNWGRFAKVLAPKLQGAWHLHQLTKELPLDFFVLFSSASSLLGNRGQANYAAANAFLDAFVHYRWAQGLPALSINWGAWSEIGVAAALDRENRQQMVAQGMGFIAPQQGLQTFAYGLKQHKPQVGVTPIDWSTFQPDGTVANPFYANLRQSAAGQAALVASPPAHLRQQLAAAAGETRNQLLLAYLRSAIAKLVGRRDPEQIDPRRGLLEIGLDSLMAIELRNQLARDLEQRLPSTVVFDYPTLEKLQHFLIELLFAPTDERLPKVRLASAPSNLHQPAITTEIAALSVEALIAQVAEDFETLQTKWPIES